MPRIDGRRLDDIVDYLNYVIVPVVFLVAAGACATGRSPRLPVLASAYGFAQADAKTEDDFFLGFPSYWNVVALYALAARASRPAAATACWSRFSVAVFVPLKYLYPSQMQRAPAHTRCGGVWLPARDRDGCCSSSAAGRDARAGLALARLSRSTTSRSRSGSAACIGRRRERALAPA